jgi:predicted RNase H-like HicB family nuclease
MPEPLLIETEIEVDSRWIAEAVDLPGVLAYGSTREEAVAMARALANAVRDEMSGQSQ